MSLRNTPSRGMRSTRKPKRRISDASESLGNPEPKRFARDTSNDAEILSKIKRQKASRPLETTDFVGEPERRKRVREILLLILSKLKQKDPTNILHQKPCSLLYPNYPFELHYDMSFVADKVNKICFFNIHQFRQAVSKVCKCQINFFPSNTVRHKFAQKFDQFCYKITTYRELLSLCDSLGIVDEIPKRQLRDVLVGNQTDTERDLNHSSDDSDGGIIEVNLATTGDTIGLNDDARLNILPPDVEPSVFMMDGRPMTLVDVTGKVYGVGDFPKKTRTIEDRAYPINYMNYGVYGSYAPKFDSRNSTMSVESSDLMLLTKKDPFRERLEKIANADHFKITEYLAKSTMGNGNAEQELLDEISYHEPDPTKLETLKELGIDVNFLEAFRPGAINRQSNIQSLLDHISTILPKLSVSQMTRLVGNKFDQIAEDEQDLADEAIETITKLLKLTAPGAAVSVPAIRQAMSS